MDWSSQAKREALVASLIKKSATDLNDLEFLILAAEMDTGKEVHPAPMAFLKGVKDGTPADAAVKLIASKFEGLDEAFLTRVTHVRAVRPLAAGVMGASSSLSLCRSPPARDSRAPRSRRLLLSPPVPMVLPATVKVTYITADRTHMKMLPPYAPTYGLDRYVEQSSQIAEHVITLPHKPEPSDPCAKFKGESAPWEMHLRVTHDPNSLAQIRELTKTFFG